MKNQGKLIFIIFFFCIERNFKVSQQNWVFNAVKYSPNKVPFALIPDVQFDKYTPVLLIARVYS